MFIPIRTDSPLRSSPYMNWALIAANVVVFLLQRTQPGLVSGRELHPHDPSLGAFFSYAFLHGDAWHLAGNMLFLYIFGNNVNDKMGHIGYLAFYLAGAVFAGVGYVLLPGADVPVIGASGAVAAVTGAYLVLLPYSTVTVLYVLFFIGTLELPGFVFVLLFFIKDVIGLSGQASLGVAYSAHVFGTLFGFLTCFAFLIVHLLPRDQFDVLALASRWNKRRQYRDLVSKGYNPFDYGGKGGAAPGAPPKPLDPHTQRIMDLRAEIFAAVGEHQLPRAAALYQDLRRIDADQVMSRQAQLDIANQLAGQQEYAQAAEAYELFLKHYPKFEQIEQVELMLGIIYARYLERNDAAREHLVRAMARLHGERELEMARAELARIESDTPTGGTAARG